MSAVSSTKPNAPEVASAQTAQSGEAARARRAQKAQDARESKGPAAPRKEAAAADGARPEISNKAREFASAKAAAANAPDVREEKIAELKRRISAGAYKVDADKVADRMVEDHLQTSGMS